MQQSKLLGNLYVSSDPRYPFMKLKPGEKAFLHEEGSGHISPRNMVLAQKKVAADQGCVLISEVVEEVKPLKRTEVPHYHEVHTAGGKAIKTKRVLICTGAFTNFRKLIPEVKQVPDITIDQETVALLNIPEDEVMRLRSMPTAIYHPKADVSKDIIGAYILPPIKYPDGLKILGIRSATCVSCRSPTGLPYVDRVTPTISIAAVGNGKGAKFSDEIGRIAAQLSTSGKWDSELPQSLFRIVWKTLS